ncbi:MAG TPA: S-layer homology domain-containing protein, partial [Acidimicrobiia bacterium]|nr:S-layer homology domain-containing protein [Acidimicrobiia bacterium]
MFLRLTGLVGLVIAAMFLLGGVALAEDLPPGGTFIDDDGDTHEPSIEAIYAAGITVGCDDRGIFFCPDRPVTRGEMAAFLDRALSLPGTQEDFFTDDETSMFEAAINRIAAAGFTLGCNPPSNTHYCPDRGMTRGEMATLLVRAFPDEVPESAPDAFTDDNSEVH